MNKNFRWLAFPILLASSALAVQSQDVNLKGRTLCLSPKSVDVSVEGPGKTNLDNLAQRLYDETVKQFDQNKIAYRAKDNCSADYEVTLSVESTAGPTRGYFTRVEVDDNVLPESVYKDYVIIWEDFYYGWTDRADADLEDYLFQQGQKSIKALARAWDDTNT